MTIVQSKIVAPDGTSAPGWVVIRLVGPGLQPDSRVSVLAPLAFRTADDGTWSRDLLPNTTFSTNSPYYVVTEQPDQGIPRQNLIHVEQSAGTVWLGSLVVAIPLPVGMDSLPYRGPVGPVGPPGPALSGVTDVAFRDAVTTTIQGPSTARTFLDTSYEKAIPRGTATAGQAVVLQANGTLAFGDVVTGTTSGGGGAVSYTSAQAIGAVGGGMVFAGSNVATPRPAVPSGAHLVWFCTERPVDMADEDVHVKIATLV